MARRPREKIAILDFSTAEVFIFTISRREDTEHFFKRKGFRESDIQWIRGDLKIHIANEESND